MTTAYTSLLGLALPVTGELSGTWGDTVNTAITSLLDSAVAGSTSLTLDTDVTLTSTTGAANQARQFVLLCTGARTAQRTITAPAQSKVYVVINATTGGFGVKLVGAGPTTGVVVPAGKKYLFAWNGSDFVTIASTNVDLASEVTGTLPATNGGTGFASYVVGDLLYAATTTTVGKLSDVATGNALISGGTNTAPSYGKIGLTTHVSGILPVANGGTNNAFFGVSGPATSVKTYTFPNSNVTIGALSVAQTWSASQRGTVTTDNDLSFDMAATNNFTCTPTAGGALTFTNITAGQSGFILLVNGANYAITAAATTKVGSTTLATISATGTYLLSYFSDGTNVYVSASGALT